MIPDDAKLKLFVFIDKFNQRKMGEYEIKPLANYCLDYKIVSDLLVDLDKTENITGLSLQNWKESLAGYLTEQSIRK